MYYKKPRPVPQKNEYIDVFRGYNAQTRIQDGEFEDMENLTSDYFPVMAPRKARKLYAAGEHLKDITVKSYNFSNGILDGRKVCWVDGPKLHIGKNNEINMGLSSGDKQIVSMGDKLIVFPDGKYVEGVDPTVHSLAASFEASGARFEMCDLEGNAFTVRFTQATTPESPADGDYWINTSGEKHTLNRYSKALGVWTGVSTVYVKITAPGIGADFRDQDGIRLTITSDNQQMKDLIGYNTIWGKTGDSITVVGILDTIQTAAVGVYREFPEMDMVFECNNRLWGCRAGYSKKLDEDFINRIYCSAWGDPTNWHRFSGRADDSYFTEVGADGVFTGGCAFRGHPYFFKESSIISVYGTNPPFSVQTTQAAGVQEGCGKSIAVDNERMFYKSRQGVCTFTGSIPVNIGEAFGATQYEHAVGECFGGKYFISMEDTDEHDYGGRHFHLFAYDIANRLWEKEDDLQVTSMAKGDYYLYAIDTKMQKIITISGNGEQAFDHQNLVNYEDTVEWFATTGDIGLSDPNQKYISKLLIRMELDEGSQVNIDVRYDRRKEWVPVGVERSTRLQSVSLPIRLERCDHLQLRFSGFGPCKIYSITKTIQKGSDRTWKD